MAPVGSDFTPPDQPTNIIARWQDRQISVDFDRPTDNDYAYCEVSLSENKISKFVVGTGIDEYVHRDEIDIGDIKYVQLRSADRNGNKSEWTPPKRVIISHITHKGARIFPAPLSPPTTTEYTFNNVSPPRTFKLNAGELSIVYNNIVPTDKNGEVWILESDTTVPKLSLIHI